MTEPIGPMQKRPWWYSGDEDAGSPSEPHGPSSSRGADAEPSSPEADGGSGPTDSPVAGLDWTALVAGAQRMVDWATDRVMAPHAEHGDPAEHPQCLVCRTLVVVGEAGYLGDPVDAADPRPGSDPEEGTDDGRRPSAPEISWIPIREAPPGEASAL